jgi:hypothetical protein
MHWGLLAAVVAIIALVPIALWSRRGRSDPGRALVLLALVSAVVVGIAAWPVLIDDDGVAGALLSSVPPLVITLAAVAANRLHRAVAIGVAWIAAVLMLAFVVVFSLGVGYAYAPTALMMLASAIVQSGPVARRVAS